MFNWPFAKRGSTMKTRASSDQMPQVDIDFARYASNDAYIKVWLPDKLVAVLNNLSATYGSSRPDVLKTLLFRHVYGIATFEAFVSWKRIQEQESAARAVASEAKFSKRRSDSIDYIGKSTENLKIWLPMLLKEDLVEQAEANALGVSDYVRMALVKSLLGDRFYTSWQRYIGAVPEEAQLEEKE